MNPNADESGADDPRLLALACEYLTELERGQRPDRRAFASRHPDLADAAAACLDGVEMVFAAGRAVRPKPAPHEPLGESLGDFRIVREIGRGGMGIVYEAVQLSLGRKVALKVLPFAAGLDGRQRQRFQTEAHAAAQLHHTNIVPVYAVGCERGVHFFAMQMIEGRPLDSLIREYRGDPSPEQRGGTTIDLYPPPTRAGDSLAAGTTTASVRRSREVYAAAVRIGVQAADALEYAHQSGVIHRDIKPGNLLIDGRGHLWIADFGLAQIQSETGHTRTGDIFGTLRYMSPEQAAGKRLQVDHRSDVYSLGATLYELLTLRPMFAGDDRQDLLRRILHEEPTALRKLDRQVPAELETIVLKAVAKNPDERYVAAGELAADLRRYQDQRPILARRPTFVERARKWFRRHPEYTVAGVLFLAAGVIGLAVSNALIAAERKNALDAYGRERDNARAAELRFDLARHSVADMIRIAEEDYDGNPRDQAHRRRLLEAAVPYYRDFIEMMADRPEIRSELEATRARLQVYLTDLAILRNAEKHMMLEETEVRRDLNLTAEQKPKIDAVLKEIHSGDRGDRSRKPIVVEMQEHENQISAILTRSQYNRLAQIQLQKQGSWILTDPEIVTRLGLTAEQRSKIRELGFPGGPLDHNRNPKAALELLTDDQRKVWKDLNGEPYNGPLWDMRGGPKRKDEKDGRGGPPKKWYGPG